MVKLLFFGATAEIVGARSFSMELTDISATKLVTDLKRKFPILTRHKLVFALNHQYVSGDEIVKDGDELAIFTAVSGG